MSRKRCTIGGKLLLSTNRKSYMSFRLVPKSVTLNDLERRNGRYFALFQRIPVASVAHCVKVHVRYLISWWVLVYGLRRLAVESSASSYSGYTDVKPDSGVLLSGGPQYGTTLRENSSLSLLHPRQRWRSIVISTFVCVPVSLSARQDISGATGAIFTKIFVHAAYGRDSVLFR